MLGESDLERLSRLLAGELDDDEAAVLRVELSRRPELQEALVRMKNLDLLVAGLTALDAEAADSSAEEALVARVMEARRLRAPRWALGAVAASLLALASGYWALASTHPLGPVLAHAPEGKMTVPAAATHILPTPSATLGGDLNARPTLLAGTVVLEPSAVVRVDGVEARARDGLAVVSVEPAHAQKHLDELLRDRPDLAVKVFAGLHPTLMLRDRATAAVWALTGHTELRIPGERVDRVLAAGEVWPSANPPPTSPKDWRSRSLALGGVSAAKDGKPVLHVETGSVDTVELGRGLLATAPAVERCFFQAQKAGLKVEGDLTLSLLLEREGLVDSTDARVKKVSVRTDQDDSVRNPVFTLCLMQALNRSVFSLARGSNSALVDVPLHFELRGDGDNQAMAMDLPSPIASGPEAEHHAVYLADRTERVDLKLGDSPGTGAVKPRVEAVLFLDFESDFCEQQLANLRALVEDRTLGVRLYLKMNPLPPTRAGELRARAELAAQEQGAALDYARALLQNRNATDEDALVELARRLDLDTLSFRRTLRSEATLARLRADQALAKQSSVAGVPTTFLNGYEMVGSRKLEDVRQRVVELGASK